MSEVEKVIALVNRKGGVTKTTSAAYIAMCLHVAGRKVTAIDTDPEQSWMKWHKAGVLPYPVLQVQGDDLEEQVETLSGFVVIDTPPNDGEILFQSSSIADEVIIPLAATALDLNRLASTLKSIASVERMRGKPLASVLLTKWKNSFVISKEVEVALAEKDVPLIDARIRDLTRYTSFITPAYLDEYNAVLKELEII